MFHWLPRSVSLALLFVALLPAGGSVAMAGERYARLTPAFESRHLSDGRLTSAPAGYVRFCTENPHDCGLSGPRISAIRLDAERMAELDRVNRGVNARIEPVTDLDHFGEVERWTYPDDGKGDCEDYVLEKRRTLLNLGWPGSVLLITVVRDREGNGHAVLTVVTDRGDLILDNQESDIVTWNETGYRYVKRQSQLDPGEWVSLGEMQAPPVVGGRR